MPFFLLSFGEQGKSGNFAANKTCRIMAIRIDTQLSGKTFYSNALNEIRISTTASSVQAQLQVTEETVFSSMYYAAYGVVQVRNLSSFFEALMEEREVSLLGFTVKAAIATAAEAAAAENAVSSTFFVLYCRDAIIDIPAETFLQDYFLTTHVSRFTTAQSCEQLSLYRPDSAGSAPITLRVKMWLSLPDGSVVSHTYQTQLSAGVGVVGISLPVPDVLLHARAAYADCRLLSFELTVDKRRCMFYVQPCPSAELFMFRNNFGCWESVSFPSESRCVLETSYSESQVDGLLSAYDVRHTRRYELESCSLVPNAMRWLEQFVRSSQVLHGQGDAAQRVLIKEYRYERSNAAGAPHQLSFSWQYADGRRAHDVLTLDSSIFTEPFNETYA